MYTDRYRNSVLMTVETGSLGVVVEPDVPCKLPQIHPCHGCIFTLGTNHTICMTGKYPDTENCINAFFKKIQTRQRAEYQKRLKQLAQT